MLNASILLSIFTIQLLMQPIFLDLHTLKKESEIINPTRKQELSPLNLLLLSSLNRIAPTIGLHLSSTINLFQTLSTDIITSSKSDPSTGQKHQSKLNIYPNQHLKSNHCRQDLNSSSHCQSLNHLFSRNLFQNQSQ